MVGLTPFFEVYAHYKVNLWRDGCGRVLNSHFYQLDDRFTDVISSSLALCYGLREVNGLARVAQLESGKTGTKLESKSKLTG